jgi:hypothetical protein
MHRLKSMQRCWCGVRCMAVHVKLFDLDLTTILDGAAYAAAMESERIALGERLLPNELCCVSFPMSCVASPSQ